MNGASGTSTPRSHTALTRPLALVHAPSQCKVSIAVSSAHDDWVAAEVLRESFAALDDPNAVGLDGAAGAPLNDNDDDDDAEERAKESDERQLALAAHFLKHVAERTEIGSDTALHTGQVLASSFAFFHARFLPQRDNDDVHSLAAALMPDVRKLVLAAYFLARSRLQQLGEHVPVAKSALLEHAGDDVQLYALFGGQGMNEVYFDELQVRVDVRAGADAEELTRASRRSTTCIALCSRRFCRKRLRRSRSSLRASSARRSSTRTASTRSRGSTTRTHARPSPTSPRAPCRSR